MTAAKIVARSTKGLDDTEYWQSEHGAVHRIAEMETDHLQRTQAFLDVSADELFMEHATRLLNAQPAGEGGSWGNVKVADLANTDPDEWLHTTPLWKAIEAEMNRRICDATPAPKLVLSVVLLNRGEHEYLVRINGEHIAGRVRWSDDAWVAAVADEDGFSPLPGGYRRRDTAVDDVVADWEARQ